MQNKAIDKVLDIIRTHLYEQPTNNVGGGKIAGTVEAGDDPPVRKKSWLQCLESRLATYLLSPMLSN